VTVALSLLAAVSYGLADFSGGIFSRRASAWSVALMAQIGGGLLVLVIALLGDGTLTGSDLAWTLLAGIGNGFGTAFLYRGLSSGRMGVVSPISGVGAVLVPVAVGLLTGERPDPVVSIGVLAALPAIWLVARDPTTAPAHAGPVGSGLVDGVLAGLGFGTLFAALAQIPEEAGLLPLALNQLVAGIAIVIVAVALGQPWLPREPAALGGIVCGVLGALATGAFLVATRHGLLSVAAVITSLYPAVTVLLAVAFLREHIHRSQAIGLALCACAVALVAAG
jgi:drug/metabolite transporter (DMT)-like permease